jgi:O-acetyl-ADP-ribose deacetylase (regulator of RNase III)
MIAVKKGNIFATDAQTIVNTVNCVGVMGAGIAYEFRLRFPAMYERYVELCKAKQINIGSLWIYKTEEKWVLNFPTKFDWKYESKVEYLEKGLQKFVATYKDKGITSIAFPLLGASNGGIPESTSLEIMQRYLSQCEIDIQIYHFDPNAYDDLFLKFKQAFNSLPEKELAEKSTLRIDFIKKLKVALERDDIKSLSRMLTVKGIGEVTLEKSFKFIMNYKQENNLFENN